MMTCFYYLVIIIKIMTGCVYIDQRTGTVWCLLTDLFFTTTINNNTPNDVLLFQSVMVMMMFMAILLRKTSVSLLVQVNMT